MRQICLVILLILTTGCEKKVERPTPRFPVKAGKVTQHDVPYFLKGVGELIASLEVEMTPAVEGTLTNVLFTSGQLVEEGDLLMTIDPRIYEADVGVIQSRIEENQARLGYALDFAETYGKLVGEEYVARLDYAQGVQNVDVYKSQIEGDQSALKRAEVKLGHTQLRAPFKGYVGLRGYDPGNYVTPSQEEVLTTVRKVTPINVSFYLSSEYVREIREQQAKDPLYLEAVLPDDTAHPLTGTLYFIDNAVNDKTGMIHLEGTIPNEDERGWPGQFVRTYLRLKMLVDAVLVPQNAIVLGQNGQFVFVLDEEEMTVSLRNVGVGIDYKNDTVIEWGLKPGEKVITDGQLNLYDGAHVFFPEEKS